MPTDKNKILHEEVEVNTDRLPHPNTTIENVPVLSIETPKTEVIPQPTGTIIEAEKTPKNSPESDGENFLEETIEGLKQTLRRKKKRPTQIPIVKDQTTTEIEKIMESDLKEAFNSLTPIQKQEFKIKGEEVAWEIRNLLKKTHIKVKTIFKLLVEWLKMLPGINKFFLEQEAKIKTDKILTLHEITKNKR